MTSIERQGLNTSILSTQSNATSAGGIDQPPSDIGNLQGMSVKRTSAWGTVGRVLLGVVTLGASEGIRAYSAYRSSVSTEGRVADFDDMARGGLGGISLSPDRSARLRQLDSMSEKAIAQLTPEQIDAMSDDEKAAIGRLFGNNDRLSFGDFAGQRVDVWLLNLKRQRGEPIHPSAAQPEPEPTHKTTMTKGDNSVQEAKALATETIKDNTVFDSQLKQSLEQARAYLSNGDLEAAHKGCDEAIAQIEREYGKSDLRLWDFKQILAETFDAENNKLSMINTLAEMTDLVEANTGKLGNSEKAGYTFSAWANYSKQNGHANQYEKYSKLALAAFEADLKEREGGDIREAKKNVAALNHRVASQLGQNGDYKEAIRHAESAFRLRLEEYGQFDPRTERSADLLKGLKAAKMEAFLAEPDE
jgi:hypothetical protein